MISVVPSTRLELLVDLLAENLGRNRDPLNFDTIVVGHPGMEHWVRLELAKRMGVVLSERFLLTHSFILRLLFQGPAKPSLLDNRRTLSWLILAALQQVDKLPRAQLIRTLMPKERSDSTLDSLRLYERAAGLAELYEQYSFSRPEWLYQWQREEPVKSVLPNRPEPSQKEKAQAALWHHLNHRVQLKGSSQPHRAEALMRFDPQGPLPHRIHLFALPALPRLMQELLMKLKGHSDVTIYDLCVCEQEFTYISRDDRDDPGLLESPGHHLLALMGQIGRENQEIFLDLAAREDDSEDYLQIQDPLSDSRHDSTTLLGKIQRSIATLEQEDLTETAPGDSSLRVFSCTGRLREVQVMRDCLFEMFETTSDLDPSDVLIMAPDIRRYEHDIQAVFSTEEDSPLHLPWSVSDRPSGTDSRLAQTLLAILHPDWKQPSVLQVFDMLEQPFIRRRFGLEAAEVANLRQHCLDQGARIRSVGMERGLDRAHSWDRALGSMLAGFALAPTPDSGSLPFQPLFGLQWSGARAVGCVYQLVRDLYGLRSAFAAAKSTEDWRALLGSLTGLCRPGDDAQRVDLMRFEGCWSDVLRDAELAGVSALTAEVLCAELDKRLQPGGLEHGFLRGRITFCSLLPMRTVPARIIGLMGMEAAGFPRKERRQGLDLMAQHRQPGDRSMRAEDLNLFLQTLMAAGEKLIISYQGCDPRDSTGKALAAPVAEILALVGKEQKNIHRSMPLQPFSPLYGRDGEAFTTYGTEWLPEET